ncbi:two-component system sensor histidine kinase KdpD [Fontibacillus phaseoli]|uniref:Two-component system sensor histidine kinase KdpD n=1 Tax=Fontibacillus phaseoli TaxID=1416533 RepID=A0A369BQ40_9BACL|nr:histidine kinase [Fontibacillus phaseoli]RCX23750.1 two-component system sensor histidine kinase KdpD [Fontibacillus phaseoli]
MAPYKRKTPEEILYSIYRLHQGRLKIIIGSVSGSGKTYHMLQEGRLLKKQGIDVVCSAVSTMQREETVQQLEELERIPSIHWWREGKEQKDLPLEDLLERNPEVLLVDGLAHRNREGASFPTRLDDIRYLMDHGISVITTINVYELAGAGELIFQMTGIRAEETVPLNTLELADEVRLIDVSPETILKRIEEGVLGDVTHPAMSTRGNLGVLREVSLRLVAEGVNDSLEKHREEHGLIGPSGATERILVSAQYHWNGSLYVRRGQQIAKRLNGDLMVVTFALRGKSMTKEQLTFKRSIVKLVERVNAKFEELSLVSLRQLPSELVNYAIQNKVTRIVMGHSQKSRWQEKWQGSIANRVLRKTRNIDVFLMADRAEQEGERILPIRPNAKGTEEPFHRLTTKEMEKKIQSIHRGSFKVYIGAAPGVGKTYKMLQEGNLLLNRRIDVVIGLLETHGREETREQIGRLCSIPRAKIQYQSTTLEEMDTEAILARHPEVVLVDELAHTNVPGSRTRKRYEDVIALLENGISVITTVNVQHLESLNDAVAQLTGVRVRETVPDAILKMAGEVELIDITPQMLQERMRAGKIYAAEKVNQALESFFKIGNLIALRELALREIADDVDERLEAWDRDVALRGPWSRREVIFVCVDLEPRAERLIRRGFRIAHRLKAEWFVHYVHCGTALTPEERKRLEALRQLTERLGGVMDVAEETRNTNIHRHLLDRMNGVQTTQLIIGQSRKPLWRTWFKESFVHYLLRNARHMDMLIVADFDPHVTESAR